MRHFEPPQHPLVFEQPRRLTDVDSWHEHIPFAFFAVAALEPRLLVELGTWKGDSYCAFCQAVQTLNLRARCYAIDTWCGDVHTGPYGPEVLAELRAHHDPLYGGFSTLLQHTFDEAAPLFADGSIDLLHIDGSHGYEAVAHDFEAWLPKLSDRGVVLLHDVNVRDEGFGVWRLWEELEPRYPGLAFSHGHGLGVLAVGDQVAAPFVGFLAAAGGDATASRFFAALGARIAAPARERLARDAAERSAAARIQAAELAAAKRVDEAGRSAARRIDDAERSAAAADEATADAVRESLRQREELEQIRGELMAARAEGDRLQWQLRARETDLEGVIGSPSWRLTAPLRTAKRDARRLRRGLRRLGVARQQRSARLRFGRADSGRARDASPPPEHDELEFRLRPRVSILTPVFNTDPKWLRRAVESVRNQTYPNWQLCIVDDGSTSKPTLDYLRSLMGDRDIDVIHLAGNSGIAAATNRALESATGEFVAFLDHDDELVPEALFECVRLLNEQPEIDAVYSDEDKIDRRGRLTEPFFKPDWSPELFRGVMYVGHLLVIRRSLVERVGGLDSTFDGVQDFELMLRISEQTDRIAHLPKILYHWRKLPQSIASSPDAKAGISDLQAAAVNRQLARAGVRAHARPNPEFPHRAIVEPAPRESWPRVTVIIPTRDAPRHLERCLGSIFRRSTYPNFSVLLVDNGTTDPDAKRLFDAFPVDVIPFDGPFNFSRANNLGVERADGELVVFLNNDTEVLTPEWLEVTVGLAELDGVGAVGPLLLYPDDTVQHAGVVLGLRGTADHIMRGFPTAVDGYAGSLSCTREVSAVTAACMVVRRDLFVELGAFDEHFATHYQDVDLCLRIRQSGRRILYTPRAVLRHDESVTRGSHYDQVDRALLLDAWGETINRGDPYYNPSLSRDGVDYRPRVTA
jgi:O-antigen biosynthesis protein